MIVLIILALYFIVAGITAGYLLQEYSEMFKGGLEGFALMVGVFWPISLPMWAGLHIVKKWH